MLVKYLQIATASGSMGGQTASHNRGGQYLRARTIPVNPGSGYQQDIRTIFGNLTTAWQTLTADQRDAWKTYADNVPILNKFGDAIVLTGQQMYIRCNAGRIHGGFDRVDDGPVIYAMDALDPVSITVSNILSACTVTFDDTQDWCDEDDGGLLIYASRQKAPTVNYHRGPYRFAETIQGDSVTPPTSTTVINSPFAYDAGNGVFFRVFSVRADGRISPVQFIGPVVVS